MGVDKANLHMREGVSQLDYLLGILDRFCVGRAVCIGAESKDQRQVPRDVLQLRDAAECSGPMAGVIAALREAGGQAVLVVACDMPLLDEGALVQIVNRRDPDRLATTFVSTDGKPEPMCCIYEGSSLIYLERLAAAGKSSLRRFLSEVEVEEVLPADGVILANVNDVSDLEEARRRLREQ